MMLLYLVVLWAGVIIGIGLMSFFAVRAYDRGVRYGREQQIAETWRRHAEETAQVNVYGKGVR